MEFGTRVLLFVLLGSALFVIIIVISVATRIPECPKSLSEDYYHCSTDIDCVFNPIFECMNRDRDFFCEADPKLLSARQQLINRVYCRCMEGRCKTFFFTN